MVRLQLRPVLPEYLKEMEKLAKFSKTLPKRFVKIVKRIPDSAYLVEEKISAQIGVEIKKLNLDRNTPVLEINPGPGLLTRQLKETLQFENITCFEEDSKLGEKLKEDLGVNVIQSNFLSFPRLHHMDKVDTGNRVSTLLDQVKIADKEINRTKNLYVFGTIPSLSFMNFTIKTLATQRVLYEDEFKWQNPIYYITLGSKAFWILMSSPKDGYFAYRPSAVLFQSFFECEYIKELPRNAFLPWEKQLENVSNKYISKNRCNSNIIHLIKLQTRRSTVETLGKENLVHFWFFVRHHLFSRRRHVIAHLEQWVPGCGPRLIRQGFTIYTQFGDMTPEEILNLYLQFTSWPEFPSSSYLSAVDKYLARVDTPEDEGFR